MHLDYPRCNLLSGMYIICSPQKRHQRVNLLNLLKLGNHGIINNISLMQTCQLWHEIYELIHKLMYNVNISTATYLYAIFQHQTCVYQTKDQYDRFNEILNEMLCSQRWHDSVSPECIKVIEKFQTTMKEKENYFAFYTHSKISVIWCNDNISYWINQ